MKEYTPVMVFLLMIFSSKRITRTRLGFITVMRSAYIALNNISIREILIPPEVEDAQAPVIMSSISRVLEYVGHRLKSKL